MTAFLFKKTRPHFSITLAGLSKQLNHQQAKNVKNVILNKPQKGHLFTVWELKLEGRTSPCLISTENVPIK